MNEPPTCSRCEEEYSLRDGMEPSKYCDLCAQELIPELEAKLAALEWKPITAESLPGDGDEIYSRYKEVYAAQRRYTDKPEHVVLRLHRGGWRYYRPINPPSQGEK